MVSLAKIYESIKRYVYIHKRGWKAKAAVTLLIPGPSPVIWIEFGNQYKTNYYEVALSCWLRDNCEHRYDRATRFTVEFENEDDAVLFKLCWMP